MSIRQLTIVNPGVRLTHPDWATAAYWCVRSDGSSFLTYTAGTYRGAKRRAREEVHSDILGTPRWGATDLTADRGPIWAV